MLWATPIAIRLTMSLPVPKVPIVSGNTELRLKSLVDCTCILYNYSLPFILSIARELLKVIDTPDRSTKTAPTNRKNREWRTCL